MRSVFFLSLMNGSDWGGSEELWFRTAVYTAKKNFKVGCAAFDWPAKAEKFKLLKEAGCEVYPLSNKGVTRKNLSEKISYKLSKRKVKRQMESFPWNDYDMVVINLGYFEMVSPYWRGLVNKIETYSLLFHNYVNDHQLKSSEKEIISKWVSGAQNNLFASEKINEYLEKQLAVKVPNAGLILNPITFDPPKSITLYPEPENGNYIFVMLAALEVERKAQDKLLLLLKEDKWKQRNWKLELYGSGKDKELIENLIREYGLSEKVQLKGHSGNVKEVLSRAHLVLQATRIDAMPLSVVEAMAMARPLVVTNVGNMEKWVTNGINGWVSNGVSIHELDQTLETAWQERSKWEEMGKHSFEVFLSKYPESPEQHLLEQVSSTRLQSDSFATSGKQKIRSARGE